jgi:hypothetical protein
MGDVLDMEWYLVARLKLKVATCDVSKLVFGGDTHHDQRREKVRVFILHNGLKDQECWKTRGSPRTFAQAFAETYRQLLEEA